MTQNLGPRQMSAKLVLTISNVDGKDIEYQFDDITIGGGLYYRKKDSAYPGVADEYVESEITLNVVEEADYLDRHPLGVPSEFGPTGDTFLDLHIVGRLEFVEHEDAPNPHLYRMYDLKLVHRLEKIERARGLKATYLCSCGKEGYGTVPFAMFPSWTPEWAARRNHKQHVKRMHAKQEQERTNA